MKTYKIIILTIVFALILAELYARHFVFNSDLTRGKAYNHLLWEIRDKDKNDFLEQPFLGYSNLPNAKKEKPVNNLGLVRFEDITIEKQTGVLRILFLGGPSTYGMGVEKAEQTFPIIIESLLQGKIDSLTNKKYNSVECLNAGLSGATSAEILTEYLFKFQYLDPDIIVVHAGFNDAYTYLCKQYGVKYQPDYHTVKRIYKNITPVKGILKYLLYSKSFGWLYINTCSEFRSYLNGIPAYNTFYKFTNNSIWFTHGNDSIFSHKYNAYYNNIKALITIAHSKNQRVLLVPEIYKKYDTLFGVGNEEWFIKCMKQNTEFARKLSKEKRVYNCELDKEAFTNEMYPNGEDRYLNELGEQTKANQILPCIINVIASEKK